MPDTVTTLGGRVRIAASVVAAGGLGTVAVLVPTALPLCCAGAAVAVAVIWWPVSRSWLAGMSAVAGTVSIGATVGRLLLDWPGVPVWGIIEVALLCMLVGAVVRWAPARAAVGAGAVVGVAAAASVLRATPESGADQLSALESVFAVAAWSMGPIAAAAAGLYGRHLDTRRRRAVADARRSQRLELARDLHDYVAHDISGMIAQAQAAQLLVEHDSPVRTALGVIEESGLAAMASMDRTVRILGADAGRGEEPAAVGALDELPRVVERFAASGDVDVRLDVEPGIAVQVPREVEQTVHRVVVEALTNVRRHAPGANLVEVVVRRDAGSIEVTVTNDVADHQAGELGRRGGVGLPALAERVEALSGRFHAGHLGDRWRVVASVPASRAGGR